MDDHIIRISGWKPEGGYWKMTIDLHALVTSAGIRKKEPDGVYTDPVTGETERYKGSYYTDYSMTKAKKLLRLIRENAGLEVIDKVSKYFTEHFAENPKLARAWEAMG